jgi:hypothetical protein
MALAEHPEMHSFDVTKWERRAKWGPSHRTATSVAVRWRRRSVRLAEAARPARPGGAPGYWQVGNLNDAMRVFQLNAPVLFRYSVVYQKVQSSTGSTVIAL